MGAAAFPPSDEVIPAPARRAVQYELDVHFHPGTSQSMSTSEQDVIAQSLELPAVPLTLEGSAVLHQMFRFRWSQWRSLSAEARARITGEAQQALAAMEGAGSALFSMFGHKGDLLFVHFRNDFEALNQAQL